MPLLVAVLAGLIFVALIFTYRQAIYTWICGLLRQSTDISPADLVKHFILEKTLSIIAVLAALFFFNILALIGINLETWSQFATPFWEKIEENVTLASSAAVELAVLFFLTLLMLQRRAQGAADA